MLATVPAVRDPPDTPPPKNSAVAAHRAISKQGTPYHACTWKRLATSSEPQHTTFRSTRPSLNSNTSIVRPRSSAKTLRETSCFAKVRWLRLTRHGIGDPVKIFLTQLRAHSNDYRKNFERVTRTVEASRFAFSGNDILLLPELVGAGSPRREYERFASSLSHSLGCYVVAGSHHELRKGKRINSGAVADPSGAIISRYDKLWPYRIELKLGIAPGTAAGQFDVSECRVLILVCADFWYSSVIMSRLNPRPDLILVPSFSASLRRSPVAARSLWRSMAVSRAYEFGAYVGISDWAHPSDYHGMKSSSVAGLADPRPQNHNGFFSAVGRRTIVAYELDLTRLRWLRQHRSAQAFLSEESLNATLSNATATRTGRSKAPSGSINARGV
jgi:omega-amidase